MSRHSDDNALLPNEGERDQLAKLLRAAGERPRPSAELESTVRSQVYAGWKADTAERRRRSRRRLALAASLLIATGLGWWLSSSWLAEPALLGTVARMDGAGRIGDADGGWTGERRFEPLRSGAEVHAGRSVMSDGGVSIALHGGGSLRLAAGSEIAVLSPERTTLRRGAVYYDSGTRSGGPNFVVETRYGEVRHIGTQFETRLVDSGLRVRVREGRVELRHGSTRSAGEAGEQLTVGADDGLERLPIATHGSEWAWIDELAPSFDIDGRSLGSFLDWAARQTGRRLVYASDAARALAASSVLHGSIADFAPDEALAAVLATTPLSMTIDGDRLLIELR